MSSAHYNKYDLLGWNYFSPNVTSKGKILDFDNHSNKNHDIQMEGSGTKIYCPQIDFLLELMAFHSNKNKSLFELIIVNGDFGRSIVYILGAKHWTLLELKCCSSNIINDVLNEKIWYSNKLQVVWTYSIVVSLNKQINV